MKIDKIKEAISYFGMDVSVKDLELNLPISFQKRYDYTEVILGKRAFLLIQEKRRGSLSTFVKQAQVMKNQSGLDVILVFNSLKDDEKKQLLNANVPYLDFNRNVYLPYLGFLFNSLKAIEPISLSASEQRLLIILLLSLETNQIDIKKMSEISGLSEPSLYRMFKKFKGYGWLGNSNRSYQLAKSRRTIFKEALPQMVSPVIAKELVSPSEFDALHQNHSFWETHLTALSQLGMLSYDKTYGEYAIDHKAYKQFSTEIKNASLDGIYLEVWSYLPLPIDSWSRFLGEHSQNLMVDPISLYLSLQDSQDPRIEEDLEGLKQKIEEYLGESNAS